LVHPNCTEDIRFACYAGFNLNHTQTFWNKLIQQTVVTGEEPSPSDWKRITTNAGIMKCAQGQADIEHVFCARNRKNPRADILFYGQDMFIIQHDVEHVFCARNRKNPRADILFYGQDMFIIQHDVVLTKK
jgi:hypothetical protein